MVEEEMRREREKRYRDTLIVRAEWALERHSLTNTAVIHVFFFPFERCISLPGREI